MTQRFVSAKKLIRYFSNSSKLVEHRAQSPVQIVVKYYFYCFVSFDINCCFKEIYAVAHTKFLVSFDFISAGTLNDTFQRGN